MASNINPTNIDETYPVAGQDNDSQGFRTNFTVIKNNLTFAKAEMEDLQNKVILKSALTGSAGAPVNDFGDTLVTRAVTKGFSGAVSDHGTVSGLETILFADGPLHKLETAGSTTLGITWPTIAAIPTVDATYLTLRVWIKVTNVSHTVTLPTPTVGLYGAEHIAGFNQSTNAITFAAVGSYLLEFSTASVAAGDEVFVSDVYGQTASIPVRTPTAIGVAGDRAGLVASDATNLYVCTGTYDGVALIWSKLTLLPI